MKYIPLFLILFLSLKSRAQGDTSEIKHAHRFWINPYQIITGRPSLTYAWKIRKADWLEITVGYQYLPYSIVKNLPISPLSSTASSPKLGAGFTGPVVSFASSEFRVNIPRRKPSPNEDALKPMMNAELRNSIRYELSYGYLWHHPDCYYGGEQNSSYTFSARKHELSAEML